jgi:cysteine synthase A
LGEKSFTLAHTLPRGEFMNESNFSTALVTIPHPWVRITALLGGQLETGSIKGIVARAMLDQAHLQPGQPVVEATSGNTGIALAALCAQRKHPCIVVMPENMRRERMSLMRFYGAQVVLTPQEGAMAGAMAMAEVLAADAGAYYPRQFENPANSQAHYAKTGPMLAQNGIPDILVCGVGTGGTISGAGKYLKEHNPELEIIGVLPQTGESIPGIGAGFSLPLLPEGLVTQWTQVHWADALREAKKSRLGCGISSGAALWAAKQAANRPENRGKSIAVVLPDGIERYLSTL